jgi:hypothetical protein
LRGSRRTRTCGFDDGRGRADQLDLPCALEQCLFGDQLAAAGDISKSRVGAVRHEIRGCSHRHERRDAKDCDRDDGGADHDGALE